VLRHPDTINEEKKSGEKKLGIPATIISKQIKNWVVVKVVLTS
jgi:hypothetical protein